MPKYIPPSRAQRNGRNDLREEGERVARAQARENGAGTRGRNATVAAIAHRADRNQPLDRRRD